jgi:apolipoprotein N-acyltransferase
VGVSSLAERKLAPFRLKYKISPSGGRILIISIACGALLGLSAPGIGLWLYAWIGLAPLIVLIATSKSKIEAMTRGFAFGFGYNAVYWSWLLGLAPLDWLGFNQWQGNLLAACALIVVSVHQALIIAIFALAYQLLPLQGVPLLRLRNKQVHLPTLWTVPLLWVLVVNKLGNAHCLTGVPWSMLEYSQYKALAIIQCASIVGGIGVNCLIVLVNTIVAVLSATYLKFAHCRSLTGSNRAAVASQALAATTLFLAALAYGFWRLNEDHQPTPVTVSVLQPNVNIDMEKNVHLYTVEDLLRQQSHLVVKCPPGLCIWTEGALPTRLGARPNLQEELGKLARERKVDMLIGSVDEDENGNVYNAVFGIAGDGTFLKEAYRKRYLVPFGEYTPVLVRYMPEWVRRLTNTPAGSGYSSGSRPLALNLSTRLISPLVCFETISPELVSSSVRQGGQLLVNLSDLAWFHKSIVGEQMLAFAVFRAIENDRFVVFSANTGPSAIISPYGTILKKIRQGDEGVLVGKVGLNSKLSPFTKWFLF